MYCSLLNFSDLRYVDNMNERIQIEIQIETQIEIQIERIVQVVVVILVIVVIIIKWIQKVRCPVKNQKDAFSTRASHVVTHRTTSRARTSLTSPSGREGVLLSLI